MKGRTTGAVALTIALTAATFCAQAQPTVSFSHVFDNNRHLNEGDSTVLTFTVTPAAPQAFTLRYDINYESADADDHAPLSGSVSVPQGAPSGQIRVTIHDDTNASEEVLEVFTLHLRDGDEYDLGEDQDVRINIQEGVCDRTPDIVEGYTRLLGGCQRVTEDNLAGIGPRFSRSRTPVPGGLKEADFWGLVAVERLSLYQKQLPSLWPRQFEGLQALQELLLYENLLVELPANVFQGLTNLETLRLDQNRLAELPANVFQGLGNLARLHLHQNGLTELPDNVFRNLTSLSELNLHQNQIAELPQNVFQGLTGLQTLRLDQNPLTGLQEDGFRDLESLETLRLDRTRLTGILLSTYFTGLTNLRELRLDQNDLQMRGGGAGSLFSGLTNLRELRLDDNQIAELPRIFARGNGNLNSLYLNQNRLTTLPEGIFANTPNLERLHLRDNPGAPFRFPLFLKPRDPTENLSEALLASEPVGVKLSLPMGAPYSLTVGLDVSGATASPDSVTIPAGDFDSESFMITRDSGANPFEIGFDELPAHPDNFDGFEIVGVPTVYDPNGTGPQVSRIRFISVSQNPGFYRPQLEETVHVDVIFDRALVVTTAQTGTSPTLALQIGDNQRAADYVPPRNKDDTLLSFSYTLTAEDDADEDGISVAAANSLRFNDATVTGLFGRPAGSTLAGPLLAAFPEHKVRWTASLSFADFDGSVWLDEGETVDAALNLDFPLQEPLVVRYTITDDTADRDDYAAGSGEITVPAGETAGTIRISIVDDDDVEPSRERFYLEFVASADYVLGTSRRLAITINEGVCDRTQQVQDALVSDSGGSDCTDLDGDDLSSVTSLDLSTRNITRITRLKEKDFLELGNLERLGLHDNDLTELPAGVFEGLSRVSQLRLRNNRLTSLPSGVFAGINRNVTASGSNNLWLFLEGNRLSSLPPRVFSGTDGLNWLNLANNRFAGDLPAGLFSGVSGSLRVLDLRSNSGAPFSLRLRIKLAGEPEPAAQAAESIDVPLRVILREGAPYRVSFRIHSPAASNISPSQEAIPAGGTESGVFTVTQAADLEQNTVSLTVESLPPNTCLSWQSVDSDECFNGLEVSAGATFVLDSNSLSPGTALKIRVFLEGALE